MVDTRTSRAFIPARAVVWAVSVLAVGAPAGQHKGACSCLGSVHSDQSEHVSVVVYLANRL